MKSQRHPSASRVVLRRRSARWSTTPRAIRPLSSARRCTAERTRFASTFRYFFFLRPPKKLRRGCSPNPYVTAGPRPRWDFWKSVEEHCGSTRIGGRQRVAEIEQPKAERLKLDGFCALRTTRVHVGNIVSLAREEASFAPL